jgi:hypothetical protein
MMYAMRIRLSEILTYQWKLISICLCLSSCQGQQKNIVDILHARDPLPNIAIDDHQENAELLVEHFSDSLTIGQKSNNKVEISYYQSEDSSYVLIQFYSSSSKGWALKNNFQFDKDGPSDCDPQISDFNNDGYNDITYISMNAARGANEVRRLFVYDHKRDQLICMKNSDEFPNMLYNKRLNCIDAFLVYGGCSTVFLHIQGDSLVPFASVDLFDGLTISEYDKNGNETVIGEDSTNKAGYIRYKNYSPLEESDEY